MFDDDDEGGPEPGNEIGPTRARANVVRDPRQLAKMHTELAISTLADVCENGGHRDRVAAATALLDRGWGKATESLEHSGPNGQAIQTAQVDLARLSSDELRMMVQLVAKARGEVGAN